MTTNPTPTTEDETPSEVRKARRVISDERLIAFLRAARGDDSVLAITVVNKQLDEGASLDEIFFTGEREGYQLSAARMAESTFEISFGCQAGPLAGDGGEWRVVFVGDAVQAFLGGTYWMS